MEDKDVIKKEEKVKVVHPMITHPVRQKQLKHEKKPARIFYTLAKYFPNLKTTLVKAEMNIEPAAYMRKAVMMSLLYAFMVLILVGVLYIYLEINPIYLVILPLITFVFFFWLWTLLPKAKMIQRANKIDEEIVFAGRHLVIALRGGITLFDGLVSVSEGYGEVSKEFRKIVERISLGEPPTQAMREVVAQCPSQYFNRVILQLVNSIVSGSDVVSALDAVLDQVATEQIIKLKEYGQKLNPMSMFFMLFGIVFPSLGVVFLTVVLAFSGSATVTAMGGLILPVMFVLLVAIQFMFLVMIEAGRPRYLI